MITCSNCNTAYDGNFCPNCGARAQPPQQEGSRPNEQPTAVPGEKARKKRGPIGIVLRVILGIILIMALIRSLNPDNSIIGIDAMRKAYKHSQEVVSQQLYFPSSAKYPKFNKDFIARAGELEYEGQTYTLYTVTAYVDSDNAFGANGRSNFVVKIGIPKGSKEDFYYYELIELE